MFVQKQRRRWHQPPHRDTVLFLNGSFKKSPTYSSSSPALGTLLYPLQLAEEPIVLELLGVSTRAELTGHNLFLFFCG